MSLPGAVADAVESRFGAIGAVRAVGGGCINEASRLETPGGLVFVKHNARAPAGMFESEAEGLRRLKEAGGLRVPEVLAVESTWLALEWLEPGSQADGYGEALGGGLAAIHRSPMAVGGWGWEGDGFIGTLAQGNRATPSWAEFWTTRRLEPQLRLATELGRRPGLAGEWERLFRLLPSILAVAEEEGPSLLHGDLWGGNILATEAGEPALVDPAAYRGHREVDLAMSELFGGFPRTFLDAYREAWPLRPGYAEVRRGVYQLYYLLVHVNLFGGGYFAQTAAALRAALAAA